MPDPAVAPPCPDLIVHELRSHAETLRREADAIEAELRSLQSFDRPDVWQGGRATEFRRGFADQLQRLTAPGTGVTDVLRVAAARIDRRADALVSGVPGAGSPAPDLGAGEFNAAACHRS